jgi:hypothetical protein
MALGHDSVEFDRATTIIRRARQNRANAMRVDLPCYDVVSVFVAIGLLADLGFVAFELYPLISAHRLDEA